jgi:arylsulfatase A-like enzyme
MGTATMAMSEALAAGSKSKRPPNIILFLTDDQDKHSIGAYGGDVLTPHLDRLAREGMIFHSAFVSSTVCTPSRYSFLTGRYAGRSHSAMYQQACPLGKQGYPSFNMELGSDNTNVGAILAKNGYAAGYVGKFHVGPDIKGQPECEAHGLKYVARDARADKASSEAFQHNERLCRSTIMGRGFSWAKHVYWGNLQSPFNHHNPEWTTEAALEFIEDNKNRPFYLHYCTTLLHGPARSWRVSMDHPHVSGEGMLDEAAGSMTDRQTLLDRLEEKGLNPDEGHAGYTWLDDSVGAILDKLDQLGIADNTLVIGIADNTLVIFTSDHGSRMKGSLYNKDGTNVPCIMRWPQCIKAGSECRELVQNVDFAPTFFELAGANVPGAYAMDGRSLVDLFDGHVPRQWRDHLYFELGSARAVCTKQWKYIAVRYTTDQIASIRNSRPEQLPKHMAYIGRLGIGTRGAANPHFFESDQLYHIAQDPTEQTNLASDAVHQGRLRKMQAMLKEDLESLGRPFGEFVTGGDAAPAGLIDGQIALVKEMKIQGKNVVLPNTDTAGQTSPDPTSYRRVQRQRLRARKKRGSRDE